MEDYGESQDVWSVWANYDGLQDAQDVCPLLFDQRLLVAMLNRAGRLSLYRQVNRQGTWGKPRIAADGLRVGARLVSTSPAEIISVNVDNSVVMAPVYADGNSELAFEQVMAPLPTKAPPAWIDAATGIDDTVHVVAVDQTGGIWHARQIPDVVRREWTEWQSVGSATMPVSVQIAVSTVGWLFLAAVHRDGRLLRP